MQLKLYNTLTRTKEALRPLDPANVRMYVCGPTVYDFAHIGNARPVIVFDVLFRLLKHLYEPKGAEVIYVRNITDVDDKINARATESIRARGGSDADLNIEIRALTDQTYQWFKDDVKALGCLPPTYEPRATEYIPQMVEMISELIEVGYAYPREGHVLFDVSRKRDYGKLSNRTVDEMIAGARVEVAPYKKSPMDFVLWKPSPPELPGWDSPWGRGRPGWHIECSAMGAALLGVTFDIHGGGIDLVFPHHENEIAQSECAHDGAPLAQVWMHNGFLQVEGEKMSKSLGNFVTIRQLLENWRGVGWPGEALRFNMLKTHYRQPLDWTVESLDASHKQLWDWYGACEGIESDQFPHDSVLDALADDLNTPLAITALHKLREAGDRKALLSSLKFLGLSGQKKNLGRKISVQASIGVEANASVGNLSARRPQLGVEARGEVGDLRVMISPDKEQRDKIDALISARNNARKSRNFKEADRIRDELAAMGVILKDSPEGTTWEVAR